MDDRVAELEGMLKVPDPAALSRQELRRIAFLKYVVEPDLSVIEMSRQPPFVGAVTLSTLNSWCVADGWAKGRKEQYEKIKATIVRHMASRMVNSHMQTLGQCREIKDRLIARLATEDFAETAPDKLVRAYCQVVEVEYKLLGVTASVLTPPADNKADAAVDEGGSGDAQLSDEEARVVALALLRKRREDAERVQIAPATPQPPKAAE
jgi:hypothetical protein